MALLTGFLLCLRLLAALVLCLKLSEVELQHGNFVKSKFQKNKFLKSVLIVIFTA
jgi:hypothetical protein